MTSISSSRNNNNNSTTYYIGFDVDHTLIKYKNDALGELIFHACARFLWEEKGYDRANLDVPYEKKYGGYRSWLQIPEIREYDFELFEPVIADQEFDKLLHKINQIIDAN